MSTAFINGLGVDYFQRSYMHSYFEKDGDVYKISDVYDRGNMICHKWNHGNGVRTSEIVPLSTFTGFSMFRIPRLGYRVDTRGNLVWLDSMRTTQRGMRMDKLSVTMVQSIKDVVNNNASNIHQDPLAVYFPKFAQFSEGLAAILDGKATAFVLDHDSAVVLDAHKENVPMSILYRQRQVGEVSETGEISYNGTVVKRSMLPKLLSKES